MPAVRRRKPVSAVLRFEDGLPPVRDCLRRIMRPVSFALLVSLFCVTAWGQDQAAIMGIVTDSSGAVVAGAKVTVANSQRGFTRQTTSNSDGEYTVPKVPIGNYEITAEAPGFQRLIRTGITLDVGQTLRADLQLT